MGDMSVARAEEDVKNNSKNFRVPTPPQKTETAKPDGVSVKPLRTLAGDIASIIKDQHLSNSALNILDKKLREEIEAYERSGGDKRIAEILKAASLEGGSEFAVPPEPRTSTPEEEPHQRETVLGENLQNLPGVPQKPPSREKEEKSPERPAPTLAALPATRTISPETPHTLLPRARETHREPPAAPKIADDREAAREILKKHREAETERASKAASLKEERARNERELRDEDARLQERARSLEEKIAALPRARSHDEEAVQKLSAERAELTKHLTSVSEREGQAEAEEHRHEETESRSAGAEERRKAETDRARAGDLREAAERERFEIDEKIARISSEIDARSEALAALDADEKKLKEELADVVARRAAIQKERAQFELRERIAEIGKLKESIEMNWIVLNEKKKRIGESLAPVLSRERELEEKKRGIETKEASASGPAARHQIESERWGIERERRKVEEERWKFEQEIEDIKRPMRELGAKYQKLLEEEEHSARELRTAPEEAGVRKTWTSK